MNNLNITQELNQEDAETCSNCGNIFRIELIQKSSDYKDFGYRYCPFCGLLTDEYANIK